MTGLEVALIGECNRCGLCCAPEGFACENLLIDGEIGQPGATRCAAYGFRYEGMPIVLRNAAGERSAGACRKNSPRETKIILQYIGKGCSLLPVDTGAST